MEPRPGGTPEITATVASRLARETPASPAPECSTCLASRESPLPDKSIPCPPASATGAAFARHKTIPAPFSLPRSNAICRRTAGSHNRPALGLARGLHAHDVEFQPGLVGNFFRQRFSGNAVLRLMPAQHKNLGPPSHPKPAAADLHFFWRRLQSQLRLAVGIHRQGRSAKQHARNNQRKSFFHASP